MLLLSRFSRVRLCVTPWTAAYQASPSMGFSRQEHWSGLPFPSLNMCVCVLNRFSRVRLCTTPWTVDCQAPLSMGFSRQEYWSGLSFPSPGGLPDPEIEPMSPALAGRFFTAEPPGKPFIGIWVSNSEIILKSRVEQIGEYILNDESQVSHSQNSK